MIFVSLHQFLKHINMIFQKLLRCVRRKEARGLHPASRILKHCHTGALDKSHCRHLVNYKKSLPVRLLVGLLRIRVMGGSKGVSSHPFHQLKIPFQITGCEGLSVYRAVLMSPEALKVNRLSVHQNIRTRNLHCPYSDGLLVLVHQLSVFPYAPDETIQISVPHLPQPDVCDLCSAAFSFYRSRLFILLVPDFQLYLLIFFQVLHQRPIVYRRVISRYLVGKVIVRNPGKGRYHQFYAPLDTGIIIEIKIRNRHQSPVLKLLRLSVRKGSCPQLRINLHHQQVFFPVYCRLADIRAKGRKASFVLRNLSAVKIHCCPVRRTGKTDFQSLPFPFFGYHKFRLIPDISAEFAVLLFRVQVGKAGGYRNIILSRNPF